MLSIRARDCVCSVCLARELSPGASQHFNLGGSGYTDLFQTWLTGCEMADVLTHLAEQIKLHTFSF